MVSRLNKLQVLLDINLREMIDHALQIHSLKVMNAYIQQVEYHLQRLDTTIRWMTATVDRMQNHYEKLLESAQKQDADHKQFKAQMHSMLSEFGKSIAIVDTQGRSIGELTDDYQDWLQREVRQRDKRIAMRDSLQQRLTVTQTIRDALKPTFQSDDAPTLDDSVRLSIYAQADTEAKRVAKDLELAEQYNQDDSIDRIRQQLRINRLRGDDSDFATK